MDMVPLLSAMYAVMGMAVAGRVLFVEREWLRQNDVNWFGLLLIFLLIVAVWPAFAVQEFN